MRGWTGVMMAEVDKRRLKIRAMLSLSAVTDALYAYYAFYHDRERTELHVHEDADGHADGFAAVCQTSERLFQPTVVLRTPKVRVAVELLDEALAPGRPYYLITTPDLREAVSEVVHMPQPQTNLLYEIDLSRFEYTINVLVVAQEGIEDRPRFLVRSQEEVVAEAGVAWLSPHFAAVYAQATPPAQERGLGRSALATCTRWVVRSGRRPLAIINPKERGAIALVEAVGYVDTGARDLAGEVVCRHQ
jgi:hypothetical protein